MSTAEPRAVLTAHRIDGHAVVNVADVLAWLRSVEAAFLRCRPADPAEVVALLADDLRDAWMNATDPSG